MNPLHRFISLTVLAALAPFCGAQDKIQLKPEDVQRLGIVFAPVKSGAAGAGPRFPATVVSSPDGVSALTAPYAGVIESWLAAPGATVRAGQPLVAIRSREVLLVQQEWMAAATARETARAELERSERLQTEGIISAQRVAQARRAHEQAAFAQQAAEDSLRRVGFTAEALAAMRGKGESLGVYRLVATADGVVTRRSGVTGDYVEANTTLLRLRADGPGWVSLQVPARIVGGLTIGQTLRLAPGGQELVLRQKDLGVDDRSQTVSLLAEFTAEADLLPGQIVSVELPAPASGVLVPGTAVVHSGNETSIFVRTPDGIESRALALQPLGADYLALSGLAAGEEVVVRGAAVLKGIKAGFGNIE